MDKIIVNKIKCKKCGDVIESFFRHHYKECKCGAVAVDGGKDYLRRVGNEEDFEELSIIKKEDNDEVLFEKIKRFDEKENEFWYARELMLTLDYYDWREFKKVIKIAINSCKHCDLDLDDNFASITNFNDEEDYKLSRLACYIIIQNANSSKLAVINTQNYIMSQEEKYESKENLNSLEEATRIFVSTQAEEKAKRLNATPEEAKQIYKETDRKIRSTFKSIDTKK